MNTTDENSHTNRPNVSPEQWAEDYAVEKLGAAADRAALDVARDAFLTGYLVGVLNSLP